MNKDEINTYLKRSLKNGSQFDQYIDRPANTNRQLDKGDTYFTAKMMKIWAENHFKQVTRLAQVLKKSSLQDTCSNIHSFLYNYIQYEIDGLLQQLRSPANSWYTARETGIDCKSYSIFASTILLNLGIKHYLRQIKQPLFNPSQFTHIYVIVPIDQITGSLSGGYYTIDGTLKNNKEPRFTAAKDVYMKDLPHIGLNAPAKRKIAKKKPVKRSVKRTTTKKTISGGIKIFR